MLHTVHWGIKVLDTLRGKGGGGSGNLLQQSFVVNMIKWLTAAHSLFNLVPLVTWTHFLSQTSKTPWCAIGLPSRPINLNSQFKNSIRNRLDILNLLCMTFLPVKNTVCTYPGKSWVWRRWESQHPAWFPPSKQSHHPTAGPSHLYASHGHAVWGRRYKRAAVCKIKQHELLHMNNDTRLSLDLVSWSNVIHNSQQLRWL